MPLSNCRRVSQLTLVTSCLLLVSACDWQEVFGGGADDAPEPSVIPSSQPSLILSPTPEPTPTPVVDFGSVVKGVGDWQMPKLDWPLNGTGIIQCSGQRGQQIPCGTLPDRDQQDARVGRDAAARLKNLPKKGEGPSSFDFTKLDKNGTELIWNDLDHRCVRDNITGLVWDVQTAQLPHAELANHRRSVNSERACGFNDWRVPSRLELHSLLDYGQTETKLNSVYFPGFIRAWYWSSSNADALSAWAVDFGEGRVFNFVTTNERSQRRLLLVRGGAECGNVSTSCTGSMRAVRVADVAAKDDKVVFTKPGLVFQRCPVGMSWESNTCTGEPSLFSWYEAVRPAWPEGWRVPNAKELSLLLRENTLPRIHTSWFPYFSGHDLPSTQLWSATLNQRTLEASDEELQAFYQDMASGDLNFGPALDKKLIILVKDSAE